MEKRAVQTISIDEDKAGQRIDNFLKTYLKSVPKSRIYRIIRKGEVRVNKKRVPPSYHLQANDQVRIPPVEINQKSTKMPSKRLSEFLSERIIYEDANLLIINKPKGLPVHGGKQTKLGIVEAFRVMYPKLPQLELAHRLDLDTSGCLIFAKKRRILRELHESFRSGAIKKIYLALTQGHWKKSELEVNVALQKNHLRSGERIVRVHHAEGKPSLTRFKPIKIFKQATLVECSLETGRTHQIRVHAKYRHHPIAGDEKYGDPLFNKAMRQLGLNRMFLHAYSVDFCLLSLEQRIQVTAPLDEDLSACLKVLE